MDFSLSHLKVFVTATREQSFSATARRLGKVQSAVSTAISELEIDLGVVLFDRSGRYPVLTVAGQALLLEAEAILSHCDGLKERASALTGEAETRIAIGVEDAFPCTVLSPVFARAVRQFPGVQCEVHQPAQHDLLELLANDTITLGLGCARAHYDPGIGFCRLGQVVFANVVHRDHPLAQLERVRFSQLADHLQLLLAAQTRHLLTVEYLKSPKTWRIHSQSAMIELLKGGVGWAIVPKRAYFGRACIG
ncbi:LysR family transcriptional regulator [Massilia orientalis]|uniref:LysR family transcriptional regulator n=1 Tax=Massilia orientalis TaxID=3050128 RepID=A0ACC7MKD8_9BURK|nr:LysR family transcriptional regulator [Massilia sp. YIM B02787]